MEVSAMQLRNFLSVIFLSSTLLTACGGGSEGVSLTISNASVTEGDSGTSDLVFTVSLNATTNADVDVEYATSDGTATEGTDYTAASGTLTIPEGSTSATVTVSVVGDTEIEGNETLNLTLSNPIEASLGTARATGTINDDDVAEQQPTLSLSDVSIDEGDSDTTGLSFTINLNPVADVDVTVDYTTTDETATAGTDYTTLSGTIIIPAGNPSATVKVSITGDTNTEIDETFLLTLSNPSGASLGTTTSATGTIINDDTGDTGSDNDGLSAILEVNGWEVWTDRYGLGEATFINYTVSSNPDLDDTDGDGLTDYEEFTYKTDPTLADTDGDTLTDAEEINRWLTSPTSVDTDGDARGPNHDLPPNALLYDGFELQNNPHRTSPTLADTDGDGRTDYEEIDHFTQSPLIADIPKLNIAIVDEVDIRLDVEYAEEEGKTSEYGSENVTEFSVGSGFHTSRTVEAGIEIGTEAEAKAGVLQWGGAKTSLKVSAKIQETYGFSAESSYTLQEAHSQYLSDSRTRTESASTGSMIMGIQLTNTGNLTYTINQLGLTARQYQPPETDDDSFSLKTVATLTPSLGGDFTLAPGASTPILQFKATDVNASRIKELLRRPNTLFLDAAYFELENAEGLNFDFIEEVTGPRTAQVLIDFGEGYSEEYRIATNVNRDNDSDYAGITLQEVMTDVLKIKYSTKSKQELYPDETSNEKVLHSVWTADGEKELQTHEDPSQGYWIVALRTERELESGVDFDSIILQGTEELLLAYIRDKDGDGLPSYEEQFYGTAETVDDVQNLGGTDAVDSDGDGLNDELEIRDSNCIHPTDENISCAWVVTLHGGNSYAVTSDPKAADQDTDGLNDLEEKTAKTDPSNPDTDLDGLNDGLDPYPLIPAKVLYVNKSVQEGGAKDGSSWLNAFDDLQLALAEASTVNSDKIPENDVVEIWVAEGIYTPAPADGDRTLSFSLLKNVGVYGGFLGSENKREQRNNNPVTNNTVLSGDLNGDDEDAPDDNNSYHVVTIDSSISLKTSTTILDGFMITDGNANGDSNINVNVRFGAGGGMKIYGGNPTLRNLFFRKNISRLGGGGIQAYRVIGVQLSDCIFSENESKGEGLPDGNVNMHAGAIAVTRIGRHPSDIDRPESDFIIKRCEFIGNITTSINNAHGERGAPAIFGRGSPSNDINNILFIEESLFENNFDNGDEPFASAIGLSQANIYISKSKFRKNRIKESVLEATPVSHFVSAVFAWKKVNALITQSEFWNNDGGGVAVGQGTLHMSNSTVAGHGYYGVNVTGGYGSVVQNTILSGNGTLSTNYEDNRNARLEYSCVSDDPGFVSETRGNLRLKDANSPCIDIGSNIIDTNIFEQGFQVLPNSDLDGNPRIVDGDDDGKAVVDAGAYEFQ